jgi:uncharacterized MAPEG superfamily protein
MAQITPALSTLNEQESETFSKGTFQSLAALGMVLGFAIPTIGYFAFAGSISPTDDMATRLALGFRWMAFPALAVVFGFQAAGLARLRSPYLDGSTPPEGSLLSLHRRYLQNTLEQFTYFFITQMALVTLLPATALHLTPIFAIQFLVGRILFWRGYLANPAYRTLGLMMNHPNMLVLGYVIFRVISSK